VTELFTALTRAVEGSAPIALGASFIWGILSILLSPCHLAAIPLLVGIIDDQDHGTPRHAFFMSLLFASGMLVTVALLGAVTAGAGRLAGSAGPVGNYIVAIVFLFVGLNLLGVLPALWSRPNQVDVGRKGYAAAFLFGLVFGIALGPCTFAYMAPMLAVTFRVAGNDFMYGVFLLLAYAVGHCAVLIAAGTATGWVQRYRDWNTRSKGALILKRICGVLVIAAGLYMLYRA
jgi:cytochrome c-type biogenesis protein